MIHSFARAVLLTLSLCVPISLSLAHDGATGVVKERMEAMKVMSDRLKAIARMLRGEQPFKAQHVAKFAKEISKHSGDAMISKFPRGSIQGPSEAVPEIWENWEEFNELARELLYASETLANQVQKSPDTIPTDAFKALARTCKACHDDFRERK